MELRRKEGNIYKRSVKTKLLNYSKMIFLSTQRTTKMSINTLQAFYLANMKRRLTLKTLYHGAERTVGLLNPTAMQMAKARKACYSKI